MNPQGILVAGIVFCIVGVIFCGLAFYLQSPKAVQAAPIGKTAGFIFYIMGTLTMVTGILAMIFHANARRSYVQLFFLLYLVCLTILFFLFTALLKDSSKK